MRQRETEVGCIDITESQKQRSPKERNNVQLRFQGPTLPNSYTEFYLQRPETKYAEVNKQANKIPTYTDVCTKTPVTEQVNSW